MIATTLRPVRLPEADAVFRPSRRDIAPETGEPDVHALCDHHEWHLGACWLWCAREDIEVTWLGPVQSSGLHADMFACRGCLYRLDQLVLRTTLAKDRASLSTSSGPAESPTARTGGGRHRRASASRWRTHARTDR